LGSRAAFTLLELILALVIAVAVAALGITAMAGLRDSAAFSEGVQRFGAALRWARADACVRGRRIQVRFDDVGRPEIYWEPLPLEDPGVFVPFAVADWRDLLDQDDLRVTACRLTGDSAYTTLLSQQLSGDDDSDLQAITFHPDGSCDSALVELAPADEDDNRRVLVHLRPAAQEPDVYEIVAGEGEEYFAAAEAGQSLRELHREVHPPLDEYE
jgi:type II secretory pathway pseudopilin PulG